MARQEDEPEQQEKNGREIPEHIIIAYKQQIPLMMLPVCLSLSLSVHPSLGDIMATHPMTLLLCNSHNDFKLLVKQKCSEKI